MRQSMKTHKHIILSILVFIGLSILSAMYIWQVEKRYMAERQSSIVENAANHAYSIQTQLSRSLSATYALATMIRLYGELQNFEALADNIIISYGGISSLQLAPQGIIKQIYPLEGNEKAIGHNLLKDPNRRTEALKTINSKELTLAGPFELIQGGQAVIGRLPIFSDNKDGSNSFWGFAIVLIRLPKLLKETKIHTLKEKGYEFKLSRIGPDSGKQIIFSQSNEDRLISPVSFSFSVPNGEWTLSISPKSGWRLSHQFYFSLVLSLIIGLTFSFLIYVLLLRSEEIRSKSTDLESSNRELQKTLAEIKTLKGIIPICSFCKKIRDDEGYWNQVEVYVKERSNADFSHGICPACIKKHYPEEMESMQPKKLDSGTTKQSA